MVPCNCSRIGIGLTHSCACRETKQFLGVSLLVLYIPNVCATEARMHLAKGHFPPDLVLSALVYTLFIIPQNSP